MKMLLCTFVWRYTNAVIIIILFIYFNTIGCKDPKS